MTYTPNPSNTDCGNLSVVGLSNDLLDDVAAIKDCVCKQYIKYIDQVNGNLTYIGVAEPGAVTNAAVWRIYKWQTSGGIQTKTFVNAGAFDQVWDDRAGLTYA